MDNGIWRTPTGVRIDARGNMSGDIKPFDGEIYMWSISSVTPIRVDRACNVTGQFAITYPITEYRRYLFLAIMSRTKDKIGDTAISPPSPEYGTIGQKAIMISMMKR